MRAQSPQLHVIPDVPLQRSEAPPILACIYTPGSSSPVCGSPLWLCVVITAWYTDPLWLCVAITASDMLKYLTLKGIVRNFGHRTPFPIEPVCYLSLEIV